MKSVLTIIILTYNEQIHLERCLDSAKLVTDEIIIVDSFSDDKTVGIAKKYGYRFYQNPFVNNAKQFQWALDNCEISTDWVMKMDADEILTSELVAEIKEKLPIAPQNIGGYQLKCRVYFMDKWIRRGYYPMVLNRIFRREAGYMEDKWMDEHIQLRTGSWDILKSDIIDHNLNNLNVWTSKHNLYSTREAIVRLDKKYNFLSGQNNLTGPSKRNKQIYLLLPKFLRGFIYFIYRYIFRLGFLDGKEGLIWHLLQGFWYQTLTDAKMVQMEYYSKKYNKPINEVIEDFFGIKVNP